MTARCWVGLWAVAGLLACGDDAASIAGTDSESGSTTTDGTTNPGDSSRGSTSSTPTSTESGSSVSVGPSSGETTSSSTDDGSSETTTGGPAADIVVHTAAPGQTVLASAADGSVLDWLTSDARGIA